MPTSLMHLGQKFTLKGKAQLSHGKFTLLQPRTVQEPSLPPLCVVCHPVSKDRKLTLSQPQRPPALLQQQCAPPSVLAAAPCGLCHPWHQ